MLKPVPALRRVLILSVCAGAFGWAQLQAAPKKKNNPVPSKPKPAPTKPKKVPTPKPTSIPARATTIIWAHGNSLWSQKSDGSPSVEEKLSLPENAKIQYLSASADGQTLAWSVDKDLYFYHRSTRHLTKVAPDNGESYICPSISPDGKSVSCRHYAREGTLCAVSEDGQVRDFGATTKDATVSRFSRDGKTIYFANGPNLYRIAAQGGEAELFVRGKYIEQFDVRNDGTLIASMPTGPTELTLGKISPDGAIQKVEVEGTNFYRPTWSPDGQSIVYSVRARYGSPADAQGVYIVSLKELKPQLLSQSASNDEGGFIWR